MNIKLSLGGKDDKNSVDRLKKAVAKREEIKAVDNLDEAWTKIFASKLSDADRLKMQEVKAAMDSGLIGRAPSDLFNKNGKPKAFSKAEAGRIYARIQESQRGAKLEALVAKMPSNYILANNALAIGQMLEDIKRNSLIGFDSETFGEKKDALDPYKGQVAGFSVTTERFNYYVPLKHVEGPNVEENVLLRDIKPALENVKTVMHNAPFDCKWFMIHFGIDLITNLHADTRIMAMALDENRTHRLKDLITDWLQEPSDNFDELFKGVPFNEVPLQVALAYAAGDTEKTVKLYRWMLNVLNAPRMADIKRLIFEIEMPVCRVFIRSDLRGVRFDTHAAKQLDRQFEKEEADLVAQIYEHLGGEINLNSPAQLSKKLYGELGVPDLKDGSTGAKVLKKLKREHPVIPLILEYRGLSKLRQAFTQKLPKSVQKSGKIHPSHNSWGAKTGRFTCSNPNTQQIPAKRPEIRHLFLATDESRILVSIDYSQIELRVLAHMANEQILIKAFEDGQDIHSVTAALISKGRFDYDAIERGKEVEGSDEQKFRKQAKIVNFGIVYGMGPGALGDTLEISKPEAQKLIDDYFEGYPGIKAYMNRQHARVTRDKFVTDIYGRKRRFHQEMRSSERWKRFGAQRQGGNFPIQASAGTILKQAVVDLEKVLSKHDAYILLQIHDELLFDCPKDIPQEALTEIRETMENAVKLVCPVRCDVEINPERWLEKVNNDEWFDMRTEIEEEEE